MWKQQRQNHKTFGTVAEPGIQLKLAESKTGPGKELRNALWKTGNTTDQVKLLWHDKSKKGWEQKISYRWELIHRPSVGLIRVKIFQGSAEFANSGNIYDKTLKGGRLGVFCHSQPNIIWSDLIYRYKANLSLSTRRCNPFKHDVM